MLKVKVQLACGGLFALGPGKADLLDAIDRAGSISAGARAMGMSYRRAWLLVDEMNRCFSEPVIRTLTGGGRERGARLSATGREALLAYRALTAQAALLAESPSYQMLAALLRTKPVPASGSIPSD